MAIAVAIAAPSALSLDGLLFGEPGSVSTEDALAALIAATVALAGVALAIESLRLRKRAEAFRLRES